ncbi:MAG: hypothetical protein HC806_05150 [Anaerolineae bacterium]|nr:hypothetical protein [Anaerolineae bacterium]
MPFSSLSQPNGGHAGITLDLTEQAEIYEAMLAVLNGEEWVAGVVSRGYFPPVALGDTSMSVYGKPAEDVIADFGSRAGDKENKPLTLILNFQW